MRLLPYLFVWCLACAVGCSSTSPTGSQWVYTGGPYAQNVSALFVDPAISGSLLAGLTNGEVFASTNDGITWAKVAVIPRAGAITSFVQDPEAPDRMFATCEQGIFVSPDRGKTWQSLTVEPGATSPPGSRILAIDPWHPDMLYAGLNGKGIYKSSDGGKTWFSASGGSDARLALGDPYTITIDISHPDIVYAGVSGLGLLRSTNAGAIWGGLTEQYSTVGSTITQIILKDKDPQVIVYGTSSGNMSKSTDGGQSWSPTRNGLEVDGILSLVSVPTNPNLLFAGTVNGIFASTDFGSSWHPLTGILPPITTYLATARRGTTGTLYAFGPGIGLQRSTDNGATWQRADTKLGGSTVSVVSTAYNGNRLYVGVRNTLLYYNEESATWVPSSVGVSGNAITSISFDQESPQIMFVTTNAGTFRSVDGGITWHNVTRGLGMVPDFVDSHPWFTTRVFASGDQGLYISTDKGSTWSQTRPGGSRFRARSLTFMPTNAGIVLGASPNAGVIATRNGGLTWEASRYGIPTNDVVAVTFDDKDPAVYYAWTSRGEGFRSINKGVEWNRYEPPWRPRDTVLIGFDRFKPSSVVALVNSRDMYYSPSGGGTWVPIPGEPLRADVVSVYWNARTGTLYAGTKDMGLYRVSIGIAIRKAFGD